MARLGEETSNAATVAERSRLAGEIHDSVQQGLSGTILHLETTMTNPSISPEVFSQLNIMKSMLSYSREEVQQAVWNLESPLLQNSTLGEALHKLAGYISSGSIETKVIVHAEPTSLQPAIQHNLLRIAQEAITNAVKHAEASRIEVELQTLAGSVLLCVTDNGKGFDPEAMARAEGHFGLRGLLSRAKSINARLGINSSPGAGTTVQVNVPIDKIHPHEPPAQIKPT
jgi:signal transduction histidine kinase